MPSPSQSPSQSVSSRGDCAHHTTVSKGGSAPLGQHKYPVLSTHSYSSVEKIVLQQLIVLKLTAGVVVFSVWV